MRWTIVKDGKKYYTYEGLVEEVAKANECTLNKLPTATFYSRWHCMKDKTYGFEYIWFEGKNYKVLADEVLYKVWIHDGHWVSFCKKGAYLD